MAEDFENPIIIGSDDDTDTDDVVIIKEEIEVDCEDVIFLSETRPEHGPLQDDRTVNINGSVITCARHQASEDKCQVLFTERNGITDTKLNSNSVCPLDLSPKPDDLSARPDDLSVKQDPNSCMIEQILCKSSKLSTDSNLVLSKAANSNKSSFMLLLNAVEDKWHSSQNLVPKLDTVCSNKNSVIDMLGMDSSVMDLNSSLCSGGVGTVLNQNDDVVTPGCGNSNATYDWSPVSMPLLGSPLILGTDSSHSTNLSLDSFKSQNVSLVLTPVSNVFPTSDGMYGSGMSYQQQTSSSDLTDNCSSHLTNKFFTDTFSVPGNSNTDTSLSISNRLSPDDPFYNSHQLLSTLDHMFPTGNSTPCTTSLSTCQANISQSSPQYGTASCISLPQPSGLVGGSGTNCQRLKQRSTFTFGCNNSPLSTYRPILKRSQSSAVNTCLYNPLTLPLSMQSHHFNRSMSTSSFSTSCGQSESTIGFQLMSPDSMQNNAGQCSSQGLSQEAHHLPPKKQKRCYSDTGQDYMCTNCFVTLVGEKYSRCPNGHVSCTKCLQDRVKLVLTGKAKESVKCLNNCCDSFYPISELRQSLPSMVVEILEDKLDQDYVNFISDMIMKNATKEIDTVNDVDENENSEIDAINIKKYEDCPGHWNVMDERLVTKNGYVEVKLEPGSAEYDDVVAKFFESMIDHNVEVTSVHRIQNPILWKYYTVKKSEMIQDNEGFGSVVEGQLFHGTTSQAVEAICRKGFDWRLCGKHGTMYGQGSYFAVNASYSHQYTDLRRSQGAVHTSMYQPQASVHTTIMYQPTPVSAMSSPNHQSLLFAADKFNFGQHLNPNSSSPTCPLTGMPVSFHRPMNLSNTATITGNQLPSSLTSALSQQQQSMYVWPGFQNSNAVSSSDVNGSSLVLNSSTSAVKSPAQSSVLTSGANSPSTSTGITPLISCLRMRRMEKLKNIIQKAKLIQKPLAIRNISGLASVAITTSMDTYKPEVKKVTAKVFYARVLVGKSTHGQPKFRKPPPLFLNGDQFGKYYDSCVDSIANPKIYVIFDSSQAYPEYLLEYTYCVD